MVDEPEPFPFESFTYFLAHLYIALCCLFYGAWSAALDILVYNLPRFFGDALVRVQSFAPHIMIAYFSTFL